MRYMILMGDVEDLKYIGEGDSLPDALQNLLVEVCGDEVEDDIEDLSIGLEALQTVALKQALEEMTT